MILNLGTNFHFISSFANFIIKLWEGAFSQVLEARIQLGEEASIMDTIITIIIMGTDTESILGSGDLIMVDMDPISALVEGITVDITEDITVGTMEVIEEEDMGMGVVVDENIILSSVFYSALVFWLKKRIVFNHFDYIFIDLPFILSDYNIKRLQNKSIKIGYK